MRSFYTFCILTLAFTLSFIHTSAQDHSIDSVLTLLKSSPHDTTRVKALIWLGETIYSTHTDSAINTFLIAKRVAEENLSELKNKKEAKLTYTFSKYLADANYDLGYLALSKGDVPSGLEYDILVIGVRV